MTDRARLDCRAGCRLSGDTIRGRQHQSTVMDDTDHDRIHIQVAKKLIPTNAPKTGIVGDPRMEKTSRYETPCGGLD